MNPADTAAPIGIFDSGVGGLSVLKVIRQELPQEGLVYLADQAHVPYGEKPQETVREFAEGITRFLLSRSCKLIVVACNAASAAALHYLRQTIPQTSFVGMEPAVKPAAEHTQSGVVGVLATPATFQGALYASVVERFAAGVRILTDTCPGLVSQVEAGRFRSPETRLILEKALHPMLEQGIDTVVLGCTHYPFVIPMIQEIAGPTVRVIDPAPAIARQVKRLLEQSGTDLAEKHAIHNSDPVRIFTTGDSSKLSELLPELIHESWSVESVHWHERPDLHLS